MLDDRQYVADARLDAASRFLRQGADRGFDRPGIGLEAEQARADLVVQLHGGAATFVVLRGDQPLVQSQILGAGGVERLRQRVEALGDGGKLLRRRPRQPHPVIALLQIGKAAAHAGERIEHPSEQEIQQDDDGDVHDQRHRAERNGVLPYLRDLVVRLSHDLHRADPLAVDDHRDVTARCPRSDERREPGGRAPVARGFGAGGRTTQHERRAGRVLHHDPYVAHQPQLRAEVGQEFFRRDLLLDETDRLAHEQLCQLHRSGDLDPRRRAGLEDRHDARHQPGNHVDQDENDEQLRPHRAPMPQRMRQPARRRPGRRERASAFGLGADEHSSRL